MYHLHEFGKSKVKVKYNRLIVIYQFVVCLIYKFC